MKMPLPIVGRRVDFDLGEKARNVGKTARQNRNAGAVQRMDQPVRDERVEAGVREHDVQPTARRRVAFEGRTQIGEDVPEGLAHDKQLNPARQSRGCSSATA